MDCDGAMGDGEARGAALGAVAAWFARADAPEAERLDEASWFTQLPGEQKKAVPVHVRVGERETVVQSFFVRAPDENPADVYDYLLRRNLRSYLLRFALADDRDVLIVGVLPHEATTEALLDRVLGQLLATADEAFAQVLRLGFASYIEREQAWRARVGAPRNPIT